MATKRSYNDGCAIAHALELIGERWALLVVRELTLGPKRFTDLRTGLPTISPNVLTQRLEELEQASIVRRRKLPPPASTWVYELTEWGMELEPVIIDIGCWAARSPTLPLGLPLSVDAFVMSLKAMFAADAAAGPKMRLELRLGEDVFHAEIAGGRLELARGSAIQPDAILSADQNALAALVYGGRKLAEAIRSGDVQVEGDKSAVQHFLTLFPLPERAPACTPKA